MKKLLLFLLLIGTIAFNYSMEQSSSIPASWVNTAAVNANISNQATPDIQQKSDIVKAIEIFLCSYADCEYYAQSKSELRPHLKTHTEDSDIELSCDFPGCEYKYYKNTNFQAHKASCHSGLIFVCHDPTCTGYVTDTKKKLKQHQVTHTKGVAKLLHCGFPGCPFTNYSRLNLNAHKRRAHKRRAH